MDEEKEISAILANTNRVGGFKIVKVTTIDTISNDAASLMQLI